MTAPKIATCLWFDRDGEDAATFYCSLIPGSRITAVSRYGKGDGLPGGMPDGLALLVEFELGGVPFQALNGGPVYVQSEAASIAVQCEDQAEVDRLWNALVGNGGQESMCGWCKDRFGVSWQIVPRAFAKMMASPDKAAVKRVFTAMMQMRKLDLATLERAFRGG